SPDHGHAASEGVCARALRGGGAYVPARATSCIQALRGESTVRKLTPKQEKFIHAYLGEARGNATEAARMAGYKGNDVTLASVGAENLKKPQISERIEAARAELRAKALLTREEILAGLAAI